MNWFTPALISVVLVHVLAIAFGRHTGDRVRQVALVSGVAGLISIPVIFIAALKGLCIAGACSNRGISAEDITGVIASALALLSLTSLIIIGVRHRRA